jgi:archaellum component FlaG (FlaF/FlaG flagellin family)
MRAVSTFISFVILILIVFSVAMVIGPWMINLSTELSKQTEQTTTSKIICQGAAYDFDPNYGIDGVEIGGDILSAKIKNTGTQNLYNFYFQLTFNNTIKYFNVTSETQKTESDPLKPNEDCILMVNITGESVSNLKNVKILNQVCPSVSVDVNI